jgi:hypothetical protein
MKLSALPLHRGTHPSAILHTFDDRGCISVTLRWCDLTALVLGRDVSIGRISVARFKRKPISERTALLIAIVAGLVLGGAGGTLWP